MWMRASASSVDKPRLIVKGMVSENSRLTSLVEIFAPAVGRVAGVMNLFVTTARPGYGFCITTNPVKRAAQPPAHSE